MNNKDMLEILKKHSNKRLSPLKSIKLYCKEVCSCGEILSWKECTFTACPLFRYRFAHGNRAKTSKPSSRLQEKPKECDLNQGADALINK